MWRRFVILFMTIASCLAIPKAGSKRELQRLVRLPRIDFPIPLNFDRTSGFTVFPVASASAADAAQLLKEAKGTPSDAPLHLKAAHLYAAGGDVANSLRSYARAADFFGRKVQADPSNLKGLLGLAESLAGLGRLAEAQGALVKAAAIAPDDNQLSLASARFYREKAWTAFAGDENRFNNATFLSVVESVVRRGSGAHIEAAQKELRSAEEQFDKISGPFKESDDFLTERSSFLSFRAVLEAAFRQIQQGERNARELREKLFDSRALDLLGAAAAKADADPALIAATMFARALRSIPGDESFGAWSQLDHDTREELSASFRQLQQIVDSGSKDAAEAAEYLGCAQVYLLKDFFGAARTLQQALRLDPLRERAWDLLVYSMFSGGDYRRMVETCEERSAMIPNARSSAMLIKSYERREDWARAEWTALSASTAYPHDFQINLSLAALLLRREDSRNFLWRAGDALNKAEKQLGSSPPRDAQLQFVVLKSIYLGLSDQPEQAKSLLSPFATPGRTAPEVAEILQALDF